MYAPWVFSALLLHAVAAKTVYYSWNVTWVWAAPDGFARPVIGINNEYPCPQLDADIGDLVIVDVWNSLGNQSAGIHWHGIHQNSSQVMDGTSSVTQCPMAPGGYMRYEFTINQPGTYWYHSHNMGQYPDGLRGPIVVHDPNFPYRDEVDGEFTLTLTDWYHAQMPDLLEQYESTLNEADNSGDEPTPDAALINDSLNTTFLVEPGKTYLFHIVCLGAFVGHAFTFDAHQMAVVEVDGVYTERTPVGALDVRMAPGQRMSVLVTMDADPAQNYAFLDIMDVNQLFLYENKSIPAGFNSNATAWLVYNQSAPLPAPPVLDTLNFIDDLTYVPYDHAPVLQPVDRQIVMAMDSADINGVTRFTINNSTYLRQPVPSLYTALSVGANYSSDPAVYGEVNPYVIEYGEVVEIVINNHHHNLHPFHLHGHWFQVLLRSGVGAGEYDGSANYSSTPISRDTIMVEPQGYVVIRFVADNPDKWPGLLFFCFVFLCREAKLTAAARVWLFHCHVEWHVEAGLMATIIEAPALLAGNVEIPADHAQVCKEYPMAMSGNAAADATDPLDLSGSDEAVAQGDRGAMYPPSSSSSR